MSWVYTGNDSNSAPGNYNVQSRNSATSAQSKEKIIIEHVEVDHHEESEHDEE